MRRACAVLALATLVWVGCGKYGPPVRTRPAPPAAAAQQVGTAGPVETTEPEEEGEPSP